MEASILLPRHHMSAVQAELDAASDPKTKVSSSVLRTVGAEAESPSAARNWFHLIRTGCHAGVQASLRASAPINATDGSGFTALMRCCVSGQLLEVLLACPDLDVNKSSAKCGSTALLLAARYRSARTVHALLKRGAAFTRDALGCSVLHKAAANSDPAVVRLLLHAHADPCARDREGRCSLATAVLHGNEATAVALLLWQQSWAAKGVLLRAAADAGRESVGAGASYDGSFDATSVAGGGPRAGANGPLGLDGLPDDCLELVLQQLASAGSGADAHSDGGRGPGGSAAQQRGDGEDEGSSRVATSSNGNSGVNGGEIVASVVASMGIVSPASHGDCHRASRPQHLPAMASVCSRFRAMCRRRAVSAWLAVEGINTRVACYHPRGQHTTLLHMAAAEGLEETTELLLRRGANPLAFDSYGRVPLQVARGRASLIAKLLMAQQIANKADVF